MATENSGSETGKVGDVDDISGVFEHWCFVLLSLSLRYIVTLCVCHSVYMCVGGGGEVLA